MYYKGTNPQKFYLKTDDIEFVKNGKFLNLKEIDKSEIPSGSFVNVTKKGEKGVLSIKIEDIED